MRTISIKQILNKIRRIYRQFPVIQKLANSPKFLNLGKDVLIFNPQKISIGDYVNIGQRAALCPLCSYNGITYPSKINIGNNVSIGAYDRIASAYSVTIEDDVLMAAFVHITDHSHGYEDVTKPIRDQNIIHKGPILIKKGAWLGFGCHVLSGVTIGEGTVVSANSVVTHSTPPHCVVAGSPARIVKIYNSKTRQWEKPKGR